MKKSLILGAMLLAAAVSFAADKVVDLSKPAAWEGNHVKAGKKAGELSVSKRVQIVAKEMIPVDAKHTYNFNGTAYKPAGKVNSASFCGYMLYDKNKKYIAQINGAPLANSESELTAAVAKGSNVLKIKANDKWKPFGHFHVGFNVKAGKLCRDYSNSALQSVKKEGNIMIVTLKAPLKKAYPAGTKVRIQTTGGYYYSNNFSLKNANPIKFGRILKQDQFWAETAYIRPMILVNWYVKPSTPANKIETIYKDLKLTIKAIK